MSMDLINYIPLKLAGSGVQFISSLSGVTSAFLAWLYGHLSSRSLSFGFIIGKSIACKWQNV